MTISELTVKPERVGEADHASFSCQSKPPAFSRWSIHFNTQLTMLVKRGLTKNEIEKRFYLASLHEIGHAIGLEHNNQEESIMTVNHDSLFSMDDISYNDVNNISLLYGFNESNEEQCLPLKKDIEECFVEGEIVKTKKCLPLKTEIEQSERMERAIRELHRNDL